MIFGVMLGIFSNALGPMENAAMKSLALDAGNPALTTAGITKAGIALASRFVRTTV
jgi:hypothetical protein